MSFSTSEARLTHSINGTWILLLVAALSDEQEEQYIRVWLFAFLALFALFAGQYLRFGSSDSERGNFAFVLAMGATLGAGYLWWGTIYQVLAVICLVAAGLLCIVPVALWLTQEAETEPSADPPEGDSSEERT